MGLGPLADGPLSGIRVVEIGNARTALAGRVMADLGAEVILVEPPGGSPLRGLPPLAEDDQVGPDRSLYWAAVALGKRSVVLDIEDARDRRRLRGLLRSSDVLIEGHTPGELANLGLGYEHLRRVNPRLIYVAVTPYGQAGPDALSPATDLVIEAAGGQVGLQGDGDRPPVPVGFPQASLHAGVQAAADTVIALCERERSGLGQHLDLSMQATMVWTLLHATGFPPNTGDDPPGTGARRSTAPREVVPGARRQVVWECADGYVHTNLFLPRLGGETINRILRRAHALGIASDTLVERDWRTWLEDLTAGTLDAGLVRGAFDAVAAFFARAPKAELASMALADGFLLGPINTTADLMADEQLIAREYWCPVDGRLYPGPFARLSRTPIRLRRRAPRAGEDQELLAEVRSDTTPRGRPRPRTGRRQQPFAGLKVADFSWVGVGPMIAKGIADHGATVVRVESAARLDVLRTQPPFKDGIPGIDRSQFMANFNTSKLGLALNLGTEQGRELARRLIAWADVVVENFTPGTMERWGLDYETLSRDRPDLVMLSTCLWGQTGPKRAFGGFGGQGAAVAGIHAITGWPDRAPSGPWGAYTDVIAPRYSIAALAAALYHRMRTGEGQHIDLSQVEAAIHFIEPLVLDYTVNGRIAGAAGHDSPYACPHGVYRAAGTERYVAIAIETAEQWRALRTVVGLEAFADPRYDDLAARHCERPAMDAAVAAWTRDRDPWEVAAQLKAAGVPAAVVARPSDLYRDPQLASRGFFVTLTHSVMGPTPYDGPATIFSTTPARLRLAAPCLGEHTQQVLTDLLGLSREEVIECAAAGVLS